MQLILLYNQLPEKLDEILLPVENRIILICRGQYRLYTKEEAWILTSQSLLFIPYGNPFQMKIMNAEIRSKAFILSFLPTPFFKQNIFGVKYTLFEKPSIHLFKLNIYDFKIISLLMRVLNSTITYGTKNAEEFLLKSLLINLIEIHQREFFESLEVQDSSHPILRGFLNLASLHYRNYHKVTDYASKLFITRNHLTKIIRSETGRSPKEFLIFFLMRDAKKLLLETNLPVSEIADDLGFSSLSSFFAFFKKNQGMSPTAFRNLMKRRY